MSTAQLGEEFGVSSITIKRALRDLQSIGALTSIPGKGTFVKDRGRFIGELDVCISSRDNARHFGFQPKMELISITKEKIMDSALNIFSPPDRTLLCVRKVIYVNNTPIMYDRAFPPPDISLIIDAAPASHEACQVFSIPTAYPTLRRLYSLKANSPTTSVIGVVESPFDRLACSASFEATY
ncbi:Transcriptional regulator, GntR family [Cupriavidus taiwanensis]|uniref:Transcriptional regulator, GntR family n=2 Tax=Cupriavidus taiwanensis TaxID=164546 RepID=A0A375JBC7_9BURK|nr:Transcriptional regulator, GntR family [Cupriavidus taiwanensis]